MKKKSGAVHVIAVILILISAAFLWYGKSTEVMTPILLAIVLSYFKEMSTLFRNGKDEKD